MKLPTLATVTGATLAGTALKSFLTQLMQALESAGLGEASRSTLTTSQTLTVSVTGLILVDATSGNVVLTLPTSGSTADDVLYFIRRVDSSANTVTVARGGTDTIEGSSGSLYVQPNGVVEVQMPAGGTNWRVTMLSGATGAGIRAQVGVPIRSQIAGLIPSTAGSSATMSFTAGEAADSTNVDLMVLSAAISKTTSAWAVGTGNGGLDTGAIANSTAYYFWLIKRVDTLVVDVLISLSSTAPTMPANYTLKRLIGWGKTNGSAQWLSFTAYEQGGGGYKHVWAVPTLELNSAVITTARTATTPVGLPAGFSSEAHLEVYASSGSTANVHVCSPDETDAAPTTTTTGLTLANLGGYAVPKIVQTSATGTIAVRATAASTTVQITCNAFAWSRR